MNFTEVNLKGLINQIALDFNTLSKSEVVLIIIFIIILLYD